MSFRIPLLVALSALVAAGCARHPEFVPDAAMEPMVHSSKDAWAPITAGGGHHAWGAPVVRVAGPPDHEPMIETPPGPHAVADSDGQYLLDTGDRLRIFVYGQPNLSRLYTVDHQGNIVLPLIGKVTARQRTTYSLAHAIRDRLGAQFVRDPQVTVDINENRPFFILGEVRNAGQFPYINGMTVQTAVAVAGGYGERARQGYGRVTRRINGVVEVLDVPSDYVLKPGDIVEIKERFF